MSVSGAAATAAPAATAAAADVFGVLEALEDVCDRMGEVVMAALGASAWAEATARLHRVESRLAAARLRIVAAADRAAVPQESGAASTGAWLAGVLGEDGARAAREARLARQLDDSCMATGAALARGEISTGHADVIACAAGKLPAGLDERQRRRVEQHLIDQAARLTPDQLRRRARRALEAVEPDPAVVDAEHERQLRAEEADAYAAARLTLCDHPDGTTSGRFVVPSLHGALLRKLLDALTSPRRAHLGAPEAQHGSPRFDDPERDAKRKAAALCEILEHLPTDRLCRGGATLLVTMDLDRLRGQFGAAHLETDAEISAAAARRLACQAGLIPAVLGRSSQPLDLGRRSRLFTDTQRAALSLRHHSCAAAGCDRPFAWTEIHHREPWARGGQTDLAQAIPLCWFHHRRIHDPDYHHREVPDGILFTRKHPGPRTWQKALQGGGLLPAAGNLRRRPECAEPAKSAGVEHTEPASRV